MFRRKGLMLLGVVLATLFVMSRPGNGQSVPGQSSVAGRVTDEGDAPVHAAMVGVKDAETGATTMVLSGTRGDFLMPRLPEGNYQITAKKQGYRTATAQLSVSGLTNTRDLTLVPVSTVPMAELSNADFNRFLPEAGSRQTHSSSFQTTPTKKEADLNCFQRASRLSIYSGSTFNDQGKPVPIRRLLCAV